MILNKIILFNYGPFYGENTIEFTKNTRNSANRKRNIILIGGKNGSGKTSIFTALQICLYGQSALGNRTYRKRYEDFLKDQIHKNNNNLFPITTASVEVDFDFSICGNCENYRVKRTWDVSSARVTEHLEVFKNGKSLDTFEQTYWQDFVKHLIPPGLLKLFFFDGERINALTSDNDNLELASAVQSLFGLDIVRQLRGDLRNFERKKLKTNGSKELGSALLETEKKIYKVNLNLDDCKSKIAHLRTKIDIKINEINKFEEKLRSIGGMIGNSRAGLKKKTDELVMEINEKNRMIRSLYQQALPFYHAKEYCRYALQRIARETKLRRRIEFRNEFMRIWSQAKEEIKAFIKTKSDLKKIQQLLMPNDQDKEATLVHDNLSDVNIVEIKQWFQVDAEKQKEQARQLARDIEEKQRVISDLAKKLDHIPDDDDEVGFYIKKINNFSKERGMIEKELLFERQREKDLYNQLRILEREKERLNSELDDLAASDRKLTLVGKTIQALQAFEKRMVETKIDALEYNVLNRFNTLLHKGDIVKSIKINKDNFEVVLEDEYKRKVNKNKLSEGEKQIYAVSMLSGITKTTKRSLPVLFDTPLGRLDSHHRSNIIHHYFPDASHQLIILSTDTEIDRQYFDELRPYLACSYLLDFDNQNKYTVVKEGYFWK